MFVIVNVIALFALLSYLGLGQRVSYASSYAASFEETFRALLGLGYVKLPQVFQDNIALSPPQMLLNLIIYYGREVIFVMILMQFFMSTLGAQFMELKARTTGLRASSIPADVAEHVWPELHAKLLKGSRQLKLRRQSGASAHQPSTSATAVQQGGSGAQSGSGGGGNLLLQQPQQQQSGLQLAASAEVLFEFLKVHYPGFVSRKTFSDRVQALRLGSHYLDLDALQQLFAQLSLQGDSSQALLQTGPARKYALNAVDAAPSTGMQEPASSSSAEGRACSSAGVRLLPPAGQAAVAAGAPAAAVAAALAAAEQLLGSCGSPVDALELQEARLGLDQLGELKLSQLQQEAEAAAADRDHVAALQPGRDYTVEVSIHASPVHAAHHCRGRSALVAMGLVMLVFSAIVALADHSMRSIMLCWHSDLKFRRQSCCWCMLQDLQALLQQELLLHHQINNAIWAAVEAMERWSTGVARWQVKVIADTNDWLAENAARMGPGAHHCPVPLPQPFDLTNSLRPQQHQQQELQQAVAAVKADLGEYGAAVMITAAKPRAEAGLDPAAASARSTGSSDPSSPSAAQQGSRWAGLPKSTSSSSAGGRTSRPSIEVPGNGTATGLAQRLQAAGGTSIRSPGGVSLHARTPGVGSKGQPLSLVARLEAGGGSHGNLAGLGAEGDEFATSSNSSGAASAGPASPAAAHRPRSALAGRNQVVPADAASFLLPEVSAPPSGSHSRSSSGAAVQQQG